MGQIVKLLVEDEIIHEVKYYGIYSSKSTNLWERLTEKEFDFADPLFWRSL